MLRVQTQLRLVARKFHSFLIRKSLPIPVLSSKMLFDGFDGSFATAFDGLFDERYTAFDERYTAFDGPTNHLKYHITASLKPKM